MKTFCCFLLNLFILPLANGQRDSSATIQFYSTVFLLEAYDLTISQETSDEGVTVHRGDYELISGQGLSAGVQWHRSGNQFVGLEVMPFRFSGAHTRHYTDEIDSASVNVAINDGRDFSIYHSYLRLSYLVAYGNGKLGFVPELSLKPYFYHRRIKPLSGQEFKQTCSNAGLMLEFLPGVQYGITRDLSLRLTVPLTLINLGFEKRTVEDPSIPLKQRHSDAFFLKAADHLWQVRLGILCRL